MYLSRLLGGAAIALQVVLPRAAAVALSENRSEVLYDVHGGYLFAHVEQSKTLFFSSEQGQSWVPLQNKLGKKLDVEFVAQSYESDESLWAISDATLWRLASDTENVSVTLPAGFSVESMIAHPTSPECVLVNGAKGAVLGCLDWAEVSPVLRFVENARHCEFVGPEVVEYICATTSQDNSLQLQSINEAPQTIYIDNQPVTGVEQLVRTPTHITAAVRDGKKLKLAVYSFDSKRWYWSTLPETRDTTSFEILRDPETLLVIAKDGSKRELWTANSKGTRFTKQLQMDSEIGVKRIGRALYSKDSSKKVVLSKNNGRTWSSDLDIVPDVTSVRTSERLNVGFNAEHSMIALSYDGIHWKLEPLPSATSDFNIVLFDYGSAIMLWSAGEDKLHLSLNGGRSWYSKLLTYGPRRNVHAHSRGPLVFFFNDASPETFLVDLTQTMGNRACTVADLEELEDSECVLGTRQRRWVRKQGTENTDSCIMGPMMNFMDPHIQNCACSVADYECDDMFMPSGGQSCAPEPELAAKLAQCNPNDNVYVSKGYLRIPGDRCHGGDQLSGHSYYDCDAGEIMMSAAGQSATSKIVEFDGQFRDYLYLPSVETAEQDETVMVSTMAGDLFVSQDQGSTWEQRPQIENILTMFKSDTPANQVYVFTSSSVERQSVWISWDRGRVFEEIHLPAAPAVYFGVMPNVVTFHPKHPDWIMYTGSNMDCETVFNCPGITFLSKDRGKQWTKIHDKTATCHWVYGLVNPTHEDLTYCFIQESAMSRMADLGFVYSEDYFASGNKTVPGLERVVGTVLDKPFVVTARAKSGGAEGIEGLVSLNGKDFAPMRFPEDAHFDRDSGFTLISTTTQSIMMFATAHSRMAHEFGVLLKSNSNGTDFVVTLENVNRGGGLYGGFVDFERVQSIEGVALANVVGNVDNVLKKGETKKLQTVITHSDGSLWAPLAAPEGECDSRHPNCRLHLHGFTERLDPRNSPSSPTAVGLIVARGNVGEYLGEMRSAKTFMSRDGGVSWIKVHERPMFWEFGDSGSIVVLIDSQEATNKLSYTLDEGDTWFEYEFSDVPVKVMNLATIPSDSSRKFIVFGQPPVSFGDKTLAIQIDFSGIASKQCEGSDFELWTPIHPQTKSPCLFGHEAQYKRKRRGRACYVGKTYSEEDGTIKRPPAKLKTCECQRSDYECDYNYKADPIDGTCKLVPGLEPQDRDQQCQGGAVAWHEVTGYRKVPISTCEGGQILSSDKEYPCPGMEDEFERQRGGRPSKPSSGHSFLGSLLIIVLLVAVGFIVFAGFTWAKSRGLTSGAIPVHLPDSFDSGNMLSASAHSSLNLLGKAWVQLSEIWEVISSHLPVIGQRSPRDHMGFYSRMDDERYRILDSDEFEDDESEDNEGEEHRSSQDSPINTE